MFPDQNIQPEAKQKLPLCSSSWLVIPGMVCRVNCLIMYIVGTPLQFSLLISFCSGGNISDAEMWREREKCKNSNETPPNNDESMASFGAK